MDLLTPARKWATNQSSQPAQVAPEHHRMPALQQVVMFLSVVGPIGALAAAMALLWHRHASGWGIGLREITVMLAMYALTGFGVTIGYHRLLTHRSFETRRGTLLLFAVLGSAAGQGMLIRWCAAHRRHHQRADRPGDPHSPHLHGHGVFGSLRGFWHAHMGWVFDADLPGLARSVPDLVGDKALLLIDQLYFVWVAIGVLLPGIALALLLHSWHGLLTGMVWGGLVRICLMQHVTWSVNSVCHVWGDRPFHSHDHSTNNLPVALLSLGEGWHNNHHAFPTSARHGLRWWQVDPSYVIIAVLQRLGLAWNVRLPTSQALAAKAIATADPGSKASAAAPR